MGWMESQLETRARYDKQTNERAYAELAASVIGDGEPIFDLSDIERTDGAVRTCLESLGVEAGEVPDNITDPEERIEWICRPTGTMRRHVRLDKDWHKTAFGPLLGQLDTGEMVALLPSGVSGYYYIEPGTGDKIRVNAARAAHIDQRAIMFYRPLPPRPLTVSDLMAFIFRVFDRGDYTLIVLSAIAATLIGLLPAQANQIAFSTVVPSGQLSLVAPLAALLLGVAVSTALINICHDLIMARVSIKLNVSCEAATFARVLSLPPSFFKEYSSGNLASRVSSMTQLTQSLASILLGVGLSLCLSIAYIFQIAFYAPMLAVPALGIALFQAVLTIVITTITAAWEHRTLEANAKLSGTVTALLNGIQKIKLAGAEDRAFARWAHGYAAYASTRYSRPVSVKALPALVTAVGLFGNILLYFIAGSAHVPLGDYMAFNVAFGQVTAAIAALAASAAQIATIGPTLDMVKPILNEASEVAEDKPSVSRLTGGIEVSGVSFRYSESSPYVVDDLSFNVRPGEYVALVGKSGCGKSTIMRLLLGFEKPERGSIFYGPYDVQKVDLRSLRRHVGMVMQDGKLFMGDLFSNITISTPEATMDDAWIAADVAGIADDIRKMPMGMQTMVSEGGGGISGGQRQRIMIARAICGKRNILMFDEATSALDNMTQKHVSDALDTLKCTRIVIAHRLSTVRHCDRILVVEDGGIIEEGTYEELMEKNGAFAELVARQQTE